MKTRPILFSSSMVYALLKGNKTQTRRIIKPQPYSQCVDIKAHGNEFFQVLVDGEGKQFDLTNTTKRLKCPYGNVGNLLWVRESFAESGKGYTYMADHRACPKGMGWKPSIFMPRAASRITLEVITIRAERLQEISEAGARAEGCSGKVDGLQLPTEEYQELWELLNGKKSWQSNPWVWVIEFNVYHKNVDALLSEGKN